MRTSSIYFLVIGTVSKPNATIWLNVAFIRKEAFFGVKPLHEVILLKIKHYNYWAFFILSSKCCNRFPLSWKIKPRYL